MLRSWHHWARWPKVVKCHYMTYLENQMLDYKALAHLSDRALRPALELVLNEACQAQRADPKSGRRIAYQVSGALSLPTVRRWKDDEPLLRMLHLAGELELPRRHRSKDASWETLRRLAESQSTQSLLSST